MKIIIIGNGIISFLTAYELIKKKKISEIIICGKSNCIGSATNAAAAMLNSFAELEYDSLKNKFDKIKFDLSTEASKKWQMINKDLKRQLKIKKNLINFGTYILNNQSAETLENNNYNFILTALKRYKEKNSLIESGDIPGYFPQERYKASQAIFIPNEGWCNPLEVLENIKTILLGSGKVKFINFHINKIFYNKNKSIINGVETSNKIKISADKYIFANGASSFDLFKKNKIDLGIQKIFYGVGASINLKINKYSNIKFSNCIRTPNRGLACGLYLVPRENREILLGASNLISPYSMDTVYAEAIKNILSGAIKEINSKLYKAGIKQINIGWRPTSCDTFPLIGQTLIKNVFLCTGTKRDGFHIGPIYASYLANLIADKTVDKRFKYFKPHRMLIRSLSRKEGVEKCLKHRINSLYQHGYKPDDGGILEKNLVGTLRDDIEKVHDKAKAYDWGIHPELLDMYRYNHI